MISNNCNKNFPDKKLPHGIHKIYLQNRYEKMLTVYEINAHLIKNNFRSKLYISKLTTAISANRNSLKKLRVVAIFRLKKLLLETEAEEHNMYRYKLQNNYIQQLQFLN